MKADGFFIFIIFVISSMSELKLIPVVSLSQTNLPVYVGRDIVIPGYVKKYTEICPQHARTLWSKSWF